MGSCSRENLTNAIFLDEVTHFVKPSGAGQNKVLQKQLPLTITYKGSNNVSRTVAITPKKQKSRFIMNEKTNDFSSSPSSSDSEIDTAKHSQKQYSQVKNGFSHNNNGVQTKYSNNNSDFILPDDDDNIFPLSTLNSINVTTVDFVFASAVFLFTAISLTVDLTLGIWHYQDGLMWASGLTVGCIVCGSLALLQQFNIMQ